MMSHVEIEGVKLEFQVLHLIYKLNGIGNMGFFLLYYFLFLMIIMWLLLICRFCTQLHKVMVYRKVSNL